jgi:DNA (cytosine-5)-methyltransferase 1
MKFNYTFIDLFAGLGGFHLALTKLGCKCVFASELKSDLREFYHMNFPDTPIEGDITKIDAKDIPAHDILCAGFPCQPFSQAGKRQGFKDEKNRGNLFDEICRIVAYHRPKYLLLENVANLKGHDNGRTWETIKYKLENELHYEVKSDILSPHQFGIPQHRRRIYIVCIDANRGNLNNFRFPSTERKVVCDITKLIDENDEDIVTLAPEKQEMLNVWQEFMDKTVASGQKIPRFPIWAMEFGATYDYANLAPAYQNKEDLIGKRGHLGKMISGSTLEECIKQLPNYAQTDKDESFPTWKKRYIEQNRLFYERNKSWLDEWLKKVENYDNSFLKMEWNCGDDANPVLEDKIIQFRASGIRVKLPTFAPALNLVGTQTPYFPWVRLPKSKWKNGVQTYGRYITIKEAAAIQGMRDLDFRPDEQGFPLTRSRISEALGNAVNVTIVKHIAKNLLSNE